MQKRIIHLPVKKTDYGAFSEASRSLNAFLGDQTGRTVSRRTTHGFISSFDLDMSENNAEHVVHGAMVASITLLSSKSTGSKIAGGLLALGLAALYQEGQ